MFLRKLTDEEVERIKKAKASIKEQRQSLQRVIKNQRKRIQEENKRLKGKDRTVDMYQSLKILQDRLFDLQNKFDALPIITGLPVIVKVEDATLLMNYNLLNKFDHLLDRSDLRCSWIKIEEKSLIIRYGKHGQSGTLELSELPEYQTELLTGLPIIDLKE